MTESARMAKAPLTKILPETLGTFRVIPAKSDTITEDEDGIQNTVSIDMVRLLPTMCEAMMGETETVIHKSQIIAEMEMEPTKMIYE